MNVAEAISSALVAEGVSLAAGITGQSIGHLADAVAESARMKVFYVRQERVAFDICDGFARVANRPGVVFSDSGPAAANAMGGLVNSAGDSVPVLFFAGHNNRFETPSRQTKEIPFLRLFEPVSKWTAMIDDPSQLTQILRRAFMCLRTGRPGPVVIALPFDVSSMEIPEFEYKPVSSNVRVRSGADPRAINSALDLLLAAESPYVYVGAGILGSAATSELVAFADLLTLPVATTLNGKSAFPEDHPLALGIGGFVRASYGSLPASVLADSADVILTIGCGFKRHAALKRPNASVRHIQIDVDPSELNKYGLADVAILGDARIVLEQLTAAARARTPIDRSVVNRRLELIQSLRRRWNSLCAPQLDSHETPINPFRVTRALTRVIDPNRAIVLHDAGSVRGSTSQHYVATRPRSFVGFGGQSAMGWSIGAAIGAKTASPDKLVVAVIGEEAFGETALDIETSVRCKAPVLIVVKNNRAFKDRDGGVSPKLAQIRFGAGVNIDALAKALGAQFYRVESPNALEETLSLAAESVNSGATAVVEVLTRRVKTSLHGLWEVKGESSH